VFDRLPTRIGVGAFVLLNFCQIAAAAGPDVIVGELQVIMRWGRVGGITGYSFGTVSCNIGDTPLLWIAETNQHPVIAQNMYRLKGGQFEQIGMAWLKHAFASTNESGVCATCQDPGTSDLLGVGCNDPYGAGLNGNQIILGPRSEVNAATGAFPYPFTNYPHTLIIDKRLQVRDEDINPALNAGALYFVEGHYVTPDDAAAAGNDNNNASYRRFTVNENSTNVFACTMTDTTEREKFGIQAWQDFDPTVTLVNIDIPGDGRLILGAKVTDLGTGFWNYEYALFNANSDRSVGSFSIPLDPGAAVPSSAFHDVSYHSGETYDPTDWPAGIAGGAITWQTTAHGVNANANALRWSTLYNFRLVTNAPPIPNSQITLGLFKPGAPASVVVIAPGPVDAPVDCNMNAIPDAVEIQMNPALDCDSNGNLDECDPDCDNNGTADACEIILNPLLDCNVDGILDVCEIPVGSPAPGGPFFCVSDCDPDCNVNGTPDSCDIAEMTSADCNANGVPDECDIAAMTSNDCNANGVPDECEIAVGSPAPGGPFFCTSGCDPDCNGNGVPDECDISSGFDGDCDTNMIPDSCDIAGNPGIDCNANGVIDACGETDCNGNSIPDDCEHPACPGILVGDMDCSGVVDPGDIPAFVQQVLSGWLSCQADMNADGNVDGLDVQDFVSAM
jgi:hypothetical protein